jgi:hypothetical protein
MKTTRHVLLALSTALCLALLASCSSEGRRCDFDTDCPGAQECVDGRCQDTGPLDPCLNKSCFPGQVCINGFCVDGDRDDDGDGWPLIDDCNDAEAGIHPFAQETCNQVDDDCDGQTDEENICGETCDQVDSPPSNGDPFACDQDTPCDRCARYQGENFYCRSLNEGPYQLVVIPGQVPCDPDHHCQIMSCKGEVFHCFGPEWRYRPGETPLDEPETCNGIDDDCDGQTDELGAESTCAQRPHAFVTCEEGECVYRCHTGYHACGEECRDDNSVESCGSRCFPCPETFHGTPICENQDCTFLCDSGYHACPNGCLDDTSIYSCGDRCDPCLEPVHGQASCDQGLCAFACDPGYLPTQDDCLRCDTEEHCGTDCEPCPGGETCCTDLCADLLTDPDHCGGCSSRCPSSAYTCCMGQGCCPPESPGCCGDYCCNAQDICCPGDYCCVPGGNCCGSFCCASPNSTCCSDGCCMDGGSCCGAGCCPGGTACCQGSFCCDTAGEVCCPDGCCPSDYPVCCPGGCCPAGYVCCAQGCCAS